MEYNGMSSNVKPGTSGQIELFDIKYESLYVLEDLTNHAKNFYDTHNHHELSNDFNIFMHAQPTSDNDPIVLVNPNAVMPKISFSNSTAATSAANVPAASQTSSVAGTAAAVNCATNAISTQQKTEMAEANASYAFDTDSIPVQKNGYFSEINAIKSKYNGQSEYCAEPTVKTEGYMQDVLERQVNEFVNENDIDLDKLFEQSSMVSMMESETSTVRMVPSQKVNAHNCHSLSEGYRLHVHGHMNNYGWQVLPQPSRPDLYSNVSAATCFPASTSPISTLSSSSSSSSTSSSSLGKNRKNRKQRCYTMPSSIRTGASGSTKADPVKEEPRRFYPKPGYSYSCLITLALKNSPTGKLRVSEIYNFLCAYFPYFKTAPTGWKNSVRHNLSLNKCFEKIEKTTNGSQAKGCHWTIHPDKLQKMEEEMLKASRKDPNAIRQALLNPDDLEALERGDFKHTFMVSSNGSQSDDADFDSTDDNFDEFLNVATTTTTTSVAVTTPKASASVAGTTSVLSSTPLRVVSNGLAPFVKRQKTTTTTTTSTVNISVLNNSVQTYTPVKHEYFYDDTDANMFFTNHL